MPARARELRKELFLASMGWNPVASGFLGFDHQYLLLNSFHYFFVVLATASMSLATAPIDCRQISSAQMQSTKTLFGPIAHNSPVRKNFVGNDVGTRSGIFSLRNFRSGFHEGFVKVVDRDDRNIRDFPICT